DDEVKQESISEEGVNNSGITNNNVLIPWTNNPSNDLYFDCPNNVTSNMNVRMTNNQQLPSCIYSKSSTSSKNAEGFVEEVVARRSSCIKLEQTSAAICPMDNNRQQQNLSNTCCDWSTNTSTSSSCSYFNKTHCDHVNCFCNYSDNNTTFVPTGDTCLNSQYVTNSNNNSPGWMNENSYYDYQQQPYVLPQKDSSSSYPQLSNSYYSSQPVQHNMTLNVPVVTNFQLNVNTHIPPQPPLTVAYPSTNSNVYSSPKHLLSPYNNSETFNNLYHNNQSHEQQLSHSYRAQTQTSSTFGLKKYNQLAYNTNRHAQKTFHREQPSHLRSWSSSVDYICRDEMYPMNTTSPTFVGNRQSTALIGNSYYQL
ncbi:unnamed protein product, partial [Didymodactylos carnosus]